MNTDRFMQANIPKSFHGFSPPRYRHFPGHECDLHSLSPAGNSVVFQWLPALCKQQLSWPLTSAHLSPTRRPSPFKHLTDKAWAFPGSGFFKVVCVTKVSIETDQHLIFLREQNSFWFFFLEPTSHLFSLLFIPFLHVQNMVSE